MDAFVEWFNYCNVELGLIDPDELEHIKNGDCATCPTKETCFGYAEAEVRAEAENIPQSVLKRMRN